MIDMMTCREKAEEWGITIRAVNQFCKSGKIPGAIKNGKSWSIPDDAARPADGRVSSGKYIKDDASKGRRPLPIGISDFAVPPLVLFVQNKKGFALIVSVSN